MAQLFRQAALNQLSEPEKLDRTLSVVSAKGWLALCTLLVFIAALVAWSVLGTVSSYVLANGILLNASGTVIDAVATETGTLTDVFVSVGQSVETGDVVAETVNHELAERHRNALLLLEEHERAFDSLKVAFEEENELFGENLIRQQERLERLERISRQLVDTTRDRLASRRKLYDERVITQVTVEQSQQALDRALQELFETARRREALEAQELRRLHEQNIRLTDVHTRVEEARLQVHALQVRLDEQRILTPVSGDVTEIKVALGSLLAAGQSVLSVKTGLKEDIEMLAYIPPADGKRVEPGMEALVSPATTKSETHGYVKGMVKSVSEFPASISGMVTVLQNRELARTFSQNGPPYASRVSFIPDPSTASGFAWTSSKAADEILVPGTLASIKFRTEKQRPITMVVPLLKKLVGQ